MLDASDLHNALERMLQLRHSARCLMMATMGAQGLPCCSYAPYLLEGANYHVYISRLSAHTQDLIDRPELSIMIIEDELLMLAFEGNVGFA